MKAITIQSKKGSKQLSLSGFDINQGFRLSTFYEDRRFLFFFKRRFTVFELVGVGNSGASLKKTFDLKGKHWIDSREIQYEL